MARDAQDDLRITDQFDFEIFWANHGKHVTAGVTVIALVIIAAFYWQHQANLQVEQAAESLSRARDAASLEQIVRDFPKSPTAPEALLRLADLYYRNGKYAEAASTYERITRDYPAHPLADSAKLSMGAVLEVQGNLDGARTQYLRIVNTSPNSYVANAARMGLARCLEAQGQEKEARQAYEELLAAGRNSPWFGQAYLRWVVLSRDMPTEKAEQALVKPTPVPLQGATPLPLKPAVP